MKTQLVHLFIVWLQIFLYAKTTDLMTSDHDMVCIESEVQNSELNAFWPSTKYCTWSSPPCIGNSSFPVISCCIKGTWNSTDECKSLIHQPPYPQCLPNMEYLDVENYSNVCYEILNRTYEDELCNYDNTLPFNLSIAQKIWGMNQLPGDGFWLPVKKERLFKWMDPNGKYQEPFTDKYKVDEDLEKNCLVYKESMPTAVLCDEYYHSICMYGPLKIYDEFYEWDRLCDALSNKIKILLPYPGNSKYDGECSRKFIKVEEMKYVLYCCLDTNLIHDQEYWFTTLTSKEYELLDLSKVESFEITDNLPPEMNLYYDGNILDINISDINKIKCFDQDACVYCFDGDLFSRIPVSLAELSFSPKYSGYYSCESFDFQGRRIQITNNTFVNRGNEFVVTMTMPYRLEDYRTLYEINKHLIDNLGNFLKANSINLRIMDQKVSNLTEGRQISLLTHWVFTTSESQIPNQPNLLKQLLKELPNSNNLSINYEDIKATYYCLGETTKAYNVILWWPQTLAKNSASSVPLCIKKDGQPLQRYCNCNFLSGCIWSEILEPCSLSSNSTELTKQLNSLINSSESPNNVLNCLDAITAFPNDFEEAHVGQVAQIFRNVHKNSSKVDLNVFSSIINNLHSINRQALADSAQSSNATDQILDMIDQIFSRSNDSKILITQKNFMLLIIDLKIEKFDALVIQNRDDYYNVTVWYDEAEQMLKNIKGYQASVRFSDELIEQIKASDNSIVIVAAYLSDVLFNQESPDQKNVTLIFSVVLPGIRGQLQGPLYIAHQASDIGYEGCAYWKYGIDRNQPIRGKWQNERAPKVSSGISICSFSHTTHFSQLISYNVTHDDLILDIITYVNCSLSILGLLAIMITALLFKAWRLNIGNQILLNFVFILSIQIILFYLSNVIYEFMSASLACTIVGIMLHYSLLSEFCWMLVIAILQFKRFVEVLGVAPKYVMVKACLCGWVLPLMPIAVILFLDPKNYQSGNAGLCYPTDLGLYLGVWMPVGLITSINCVIFIFIIYSVVHRKTECVDTVSNEVIFQWRLALLLFFMLGLTWGFGFLSLIGFGLIFEYLFCITATLQGFVMFLFFIVFNKNTRLMYVHFFRLYLRMK